MSVQTDPTSHEAFRVVERPEFAPHFCAVTLDEHCDEGFIDTCNEMQQIGSRIYISVTGVKRLAKFLCLEDAQPYIDRNVELERKIADLEAELDTVEQALGAIDRLQRVGYRAQAKPGRKPKIRDEEVAA